MPPAAATRAGLTKYQALTHISVPQRSDGGVLTGQNDLVPPGEIVELTEREAANLMAVGGATGRRVPAVRPYKDRAQDLPRLTGRDLSGLIRQPATPPPGDTGPRPDPPGSSTVRVVETGSGLPESAEPQPGSEQAPDLGAVDLPPRGMTAGS